MSKNILVTGSTGFIGKVLVSNLLDNGNMVTGMSLEKSCFNNPNYKHIRSHIRGEVNFPKSDSIFHLAGPVNDSSRFTDDEFINMSLELTKNVLELIVDPSNTVFVYASSCGIYALNSSEIIDEKVPPEPIEKYSRGKLLAEDYIIEFSKKNHMNYVIARIFNVYGPNETYSIVSKIINSINTSSSMPFNSDIERDFIHVEDVASGLMKLSETGSGIYNLGSGKSYSLGNLLELIENKMGKNLLLEKFEGPKIKKSGANIKKIGSINWKPLIDIEEGIDSLLN